MAVALSLMVLLSLVPMSALATEYDATKTGDYYTIIAKNDYVLCDGATESEIVLNNSAGTRRQILHVMEIDPNNTNVEVLPSYYQIDQDLTDKSNWTAQIMEKQMDYYRDELGYNVVGGMNTALAYDNEAPYGVMVYNGQVLADGTVHSGAQTYLAVIKNEDGTVKFELRPVSGGLQGDEWQAVSANFGFVIKNGELVSKTVERTSAAADRSMIGIKADGNLVICQAEGRNAPYAVGLSSYEIGEAMLALGCVWAVNGDGGGSSQFLTKREGESDYSIRNIPSDGSPRATINGIIIASKIVADGVFDHVSMTTENTYITPGTSVEVDVRGVDASGAAADLPESGLTFTATNGTFENGVFTSDGTVGEAVITAYYNGEAVGDITINVVVPTSFSFDLANFVVPYGKSVSLDMTALYGTMEMVCKPADFVFTLDNNTIGTVNNGTFSAVTEEVENCEATLTATMVHNTALTATAGIMLGKGSEVLYSFEDQNLHGWYRYTAASYNYNNPTGETAIVDASTGKVHNGDYAMAVEVNFSNSLEAGFQLGSLMTGEDIVIEKGTRLGMWIYIPDEACGLNIDSGMPGLGGKWEVEGAGEAKGTEVGFVYAFEESGWYYISKDISSVPSLTIPKGYQLLKFYISQKDGKNGYSYGDQTDVNGRYVFYVDDITVDYSSAVDDREAPVFGSVTYATSGMDEGVVLNKDISAGYKTVTVTDNNLKFTAAVAENTTKNNYTGINTASAKVFVDGVDYTKSLIWAGSRMSLDVTLADGRHEVKFSVCDNAGNYASVIREIIVNSVDNAPIKVAFHNPDADRLLLGSVNYIDVVAAEIEKVKSVSVTMDLNNISTWHLDHMEVAAGFAATYTLAADENIATVTITKVGTVAAAGEGILVSIPVRTWEMAPVPAIFGHPGKVWMYPDYKKGNEILPMSLSVETDGGIVTFEDGTTATFASPKLLVMTELSGNAYTSSGSAANNYIRGEEWYATWNGGHDHRPETAQYYAEGATNVATPVALPDKAPTCTETGYTGRTYCEVCNSVVDWGTVTPATGHTYAVVGDQIACECGETMVATGIVEVNEKLYYMIGGKLLSGWQTVGSIYCYADPATMEVKTGEFTVNGLTYTAGEDGLLVSGVWVEDFLGKRYSYGPAFYDRCFVTIDGDEYYFAEKTGYALTGYHTIPDNRNNPNAPVRWYHFAEDGKLIERMKMTGVLDTGNGLFYMEEGCVAFPGMIKIGDDYYCVADKKGTVLTGYNWVGSYIMANSVNPMANGYYEFGADGKMLQGIVVKEDGTYYYEMGKPFAAGWVKDGDDYYCFANGGKAMVGSNWVGTYLTQTSKDPYKSGNFIFDADGKLANGIAETDNGWYYCEAGVGKEAYLVNVDGQYYYADKGGKLATGRIWVGTYPSHGMIPKGYYEFGANGAMLNGVVAKEDGTYYYENGQTVDTGWLKVGNDYYVFTNGGKAMTGLNWVGSYLTETSRDPYMKGNFYFTADGKLANGVAQKDDGWYYFAAGVATKEGLVNLDGSYYLAEDGGKLATGRVWVGTYASNGLLPKGYYEFGADGKMLQGVAEKEDGLYYYDLGNTQYLGLIERDGEFYYVNEGGKLETGRVWVGSYASNGLMTKGYYEFGADGAMLNGFETLADGIYYYNMGVAQRIGLKVIDGDLYYITDGGKVVTGTVWVGTYDSNGLLPKGNYTFAEDGKFVG
jgi:glucan-binding YG repeat protein